MRALYTLTIFLYSVLLRLVAPVNRKARLLVAGRKRWQQPFAQNPLDPARPVAWFHAASLGEFEQGRPLIEAFRAAYPRWQVVLSFFSPSGYEVRKTYAGADVVTYLPADTAANARLWVAQVRPDLAVFIKYEFWHYYLWELRSRQITTLSVSAIFRPEQLFFQPYGAFYRTILGCFDHFFVQNQESVNLLAGIGIEAVTLAGDTRFDRVAQVAATKRPIPEAAAFVGQGGDANPPVLVVGSAWPADMAVLIPVLNAFAGPLRVIIAPHEIHETDLAQWETQLTAPSVRFSAWPTNAPAPEGRYLFIDNIGMLTSLYQYGTVAYIGGGFGRGLHNCLEAATFDLPLLFGPRHQKFQEALDLVARGGAFQVRSQTDLARVFTHLCSNAAAQQAAGAVCRQYVAEHTGATAQIMAWLGQNSPPVVGGQG